MKLLLTLNPSKDLIEQIHLAKNIGFDGVEIVLEDLAQKKFFDEKYRKEILKIAKENNMILYFHLPAYLDVRKEKDLDEIKKFLEIIYKEFEKSFCILHIYAENLYEIKDFKKSVKNLDISKILFENLFQDINFLEKIFKENLNFVIDLQHLLISNSLSKSLNFLRKNKEKILHFHISDSDGINHLHLPLGNGALPLKKIIEFLRENFDDRTITFEIFLTEIPEIDIEASYFLFKKLYYGKC